MTEAPPADECTPDRAARWAFIASLALGVLVASRLLERDPAAVAILDRLVHAARALAYIVIASLVGYGFGRPLFAWSRLFDEPDEPVMTASAATGLGLGLAGLTTLAVGWLGLLGLPYVILLTFAGLALAWSRRAGIRDAGASLASTLDVTALVVALLLVQPLMLVSCPPIYGDEVTYHTFLPAEFARTGSIPTFGPSRYLAYPLLPHALATPGVIAGVEEAPRANQLLFTLLTLAFLAAWSRARGLPPWIAPALYLASPIILLYSGIAFVPAMKAYYQLVLLAGYLALMRSPDPRGAIVLGILAGCFLWTKQVALAFCAFLTLLWIAGLGAPRRITFLVLAVAGLVHLPHLVKNAIHTGDPLFPYGGAVFVGKGWNSFLTLNQLTLDSRLATPTWPDKLAAVRDILLGPDRSNIEREPLGLQVVAFLPLAWLGSLRRRDGDRGGLFIGAFSAFYTFLWIAGAGPLVTRTLTPLMPGIALLQAEGLARLGSRGRSAGAAALGATLIFLWLQAPVRPLGLVLPYLGGLETREQHLARAWGNVYRVHASMNEQLPPGTPVLGVYSAERALTHCRLIPSHDVEGSFVMASEAMHRAIESHASRFPALTAPWMNQLPVITTREDALAQLTGRGIGHVLVNEELGLPLDHTLIPLLKPDLEPLIQAGGVTLYRVRAAK